MKRPPRLILCGRVEPMRNTLRKTIGRIWNRLFDPWWDWYYTHFRHPPKYHCTDDPWLLDHWDENPYEPNCFPLPFWINCFGCMGCSSIHKPPFQPDIRKGPYKLHFQPLFIEQYSELFGKDAAFDLIWGFQKKYLQETPQDI